MIPDRLPSGGSAGERKASALLQLAGERKASALLQQLPGDVIAYYEAGT
jgi:hypothetical protein